jgi:hypothetical protein
MRRNWWKHGLKIALLVVVAVAALGAVVMGLWNALLPDIFGWREIGFWQAVGLLALSKILLGGWRGGHGYHRHWRERMAERWDQMSDEERARFREGMRWRCGHHREPAPQGGGEPSA